MSGGEPETPFFTEEGRPSYSLLKVITAWLLCLHAAKEHGLAQQGGKGTGRVGAFPEQVALRPAVLPGPSAAK